MKIAKIGRSGFGTCAAIVLLSACGGTPTTIGAPGAELHGTQSGLAQPERSDAGSSWMAPDAIDQKLLYVADIFKVSVYAYPGGKLEGRLSGFLASSGECVDEKGDVFITDEVGERIVEYAHGRTNPIETLQPAAEHPLGCAVDPTTGNLAVTTFGNNSGGDLAIYDHARGGPTTYSDPDILRYYLCGYDNAGDLFVDGTSPPSSGGHFVLAELRKGNSTFNDITLNQTIAFPGGVQWDGNYLEVADHKTSVIYRFRISGNSGIEVRSTPLGSPAFDVFQFYIDGRTVIAPNEYSNGHRRVSDVLYYRYPAGGLPIKTITNAVHEPQGVVVSKFSS